MRHCTRSALMAASFVFTASTAQAASIGEDNQSQASSALQWQTRESIVGPNTGKIGGSFLQAQVSVNFDPVADPMKPLLSVDMPKGVVLKASWTDTSWIQLAVVDGGATDGTLKAEHTLAPHVTLFIEVGFLGLKTKYDYNAEALLDAIPGAAWNYVGVAAQPFAPWGFAPASVVVPAPSLDAAQLFSIQLPQIIGSAAINGQIAVNATTSPTFTYTTKQVSLAAGDALTSNTGVHKVKTIDANYIDIPANVKGEIAYKGTLLVRPSATVTSIAGFSLPFPLVLDIAAAGVSMPYNSGTAPIAVEFPQTVFHIPLPNVKLPSKTLEMGTTDVGKTTTKQALINNTGEMKASLTFTSSDPQFEVVTAKRYADPKGKYDLDVKFTPKSEGLQTAEITVASNDPDEPSQIIHVTGTGGKIAVPTPEPDPNGNGTGEPEPQPGSDSGCGCRTAPATSDIAGLGVFGIVLGAVLRRRRRH